MAHQILTLLLLSVFLTTAKSSANEDLGKNSLESDRRQQMNNSSLLKVKSQGPRRADNGCWQIKYYYRLQMVSREYLIVGKVWSQKWIVLWCLLLHWLWRHTAERSWLYRRMHLHEVVLFNTDSYIHHSAFTWDSNIMEAESLPIIISSWIGNFLSSKLKASHFWVKPQCCAWKKVNGLHKGLGIMTGVDIALLTPLTRWMRWVHILSQNMKQN